MDGGGLDADGGHSARHPDVAEIYGDNGCFGRSLAPEVHHGLDLAVVNALEIFLRAAQVHLDRDNILVEYGHAVVDADHEGNAVEGDLVADDLPY